MSCENTLRIILGYRLLQLKSRVVMINSFFFHWNTECKITGRHPPISVRFIRMTTKISMWSDNMTDQDQVTVCAEFQSLLARSLSVNIIMKQAELSTSLTSEAKRRRVGYNTFMKQQRDYDCEWQTLTWLECQSEMEHEKVVKKLSCCICTKYQDHIKGRKTSAKNGSRVPNRYAHRTFETTPYANNTSTR